MVVQAHTWVLEVQDRQALEAMQTRPVRQPKGKEPKNQLHK